MNAASRYVLDYDDRGNSVVVWSSYKIYQQLRLIKTSVGGVHPNVASHWTRLPMTRENVLVVESLETPDTVTNAYIEARQRIFTPTADELKPVLELEALLPRPLFPHQRDFCAFALGYDFVYNGSEQGTGKTASAWVMSRLWNSRRIMIICPKTIARQWASECKSVLGELSPDILVLDSGNITERGALLLDYDIDGDTGPRAVILNYECVYQLQEICQIYKPDLLIFDEAWRLKSPSAQVTKASLNIAYQCPHVMLCSGTPIGNDVGDLYSQLKLLNVEMPFRRHAEFLGRYAFMRSVPGPYGRQVMRPFGCSDPAGIMSLLIEAGWYRATKATCLDLPPKIFTSVKLLLNPEQKAVYDRVKKDGEQALDPLSLSGQRMTVLRLQQIVGGFVPILGEELRALEDTPSAIKVRAISSAKLDWLVEWTKSTLVNDRSKRVIVWCKFNSEVEAITLSLSCFLGLDSVKAVTGAVDNDELDLIKESFNSRDPDGVIVIVAQIKKLAYGHNLQAGDYNVYFSHTWSYVEYAQSQDRTHRAGRQGTVEYLILEAINTVDAKVLLALENKQSLADQFSPDTSSPEKEGDMIDVNR